VIFTWLEHLITLVLGLVADGIGMDVDQPCGLEDATALGDVVEDREDLVLGQMGAIQRCALAFGAVGPATAA
jgi:hypothetical protein